MTTTIRLINPAPLHRFLICSLVQNCTVYDTLPQRHYTSAACRQTVAISAQCMSTEYDCKLAPLRYCSQFAESLTLANSPRYCRLLNARCHFTAHTWAQSTTDWNLTSFMAVLINSKYVCWSVYCCPIYHDSVKKFKYYGGFVWGFKLVLTGNFETLYSSFELSHLPKQNDGRVWCSWSTLEMPGSVHVKQWYNLWMVPYSFQEVYERIWLKYILSYRIS